MQQERQGLQSTKASLWKKKTKITTINNTRVIQEEENHTFPPSVKNNIGGNKNSFQTNNTLEEIKEEEVHYFFPPRTSLNRYYNQRKEIQKESDLDAFHLSLVLNIKSKEVLYFLCDTRNLDVTYSDLT